jgi:hypothetical protein
LIEVLIEIEHGIDDHLGEELLILGNNLGVQRGLSALDQEISLLFLALVCDLDGDLLDSLEALSASLSVSLDDDLGVHAFLNEGLGLLQKLSGGDDDRGGSISDFVVLGSGNIHKGLSGWMNNIEEANQSSAIIRDGD